MQKMAGREGWLDVARCLACVCVLVIHCPGPECGSGLLHAIVNYYAVSLASVMFFMISGALVLWRPVDDALPWLRHRLGRVVIPMVIWTVVTLLVNFAMGRLLPADLLRRLLLIPVQAQEGAFWFIYVVAGIYLVAPVVASWLNSARQRDVLLYIGLWFATLFVPWVAHIVPEAELVTSDGYGYLYHFHGYLGLAVAGYYIRRYGVPCRMRWLLLALVALMALPVALRAAHVPGGLWTPRLSPNIVAITIVVFALLRGTSYLVLRTSYFGLMARYTFGIYLMHKLIIMCVLGPLLWPLHLGYAVEVPLMVIGTIAIAVPAIMLLRRLPCHRLLC